MTGKVGLGVPPDRVAAIGMSVGMSRWTVKRLSVGGGRWTVIGLPTTDYRSLTTDYRSEGARLWFFGGVGEGGRGVR